MVYEECKNKIGIAVSNLSFSQLAFNIVKQVNAALAQNCKRNITVFYEEPRPAFASFLFPSMHIAEAYEWSGTLIATNLSTAQKIISFPTAARRYFYVWELEWLRMQNVPFEQLHYIYNNSKLRLIARSPDYSLLLKECFNVDVNLFMEDFNLGVINDR